MNVRWIGPVERKHEHALETPWMSLPSNWKAPSALIAHERISGSGAKLPTAAATTLARYVKPTNVPACCIAHRRVWRNFDSY